MLIDLVPRGGRYPLALARYDVENIRAQLVIQGDMVHLRIEDLTNVDRWRCSVSTGRPSCRSSSGPKSRELRVEAHLSPRS
jgi:hypothetical protein